MTTTKIHTICEIHNQAAIVGPGSLLDELECTICVAIEDGLLPAPVATDPEELFMDGITSHDGGNCCCESCEPDFCYNCGHYTQFCTCFSVAIESPNFCDGQHPTAAPPF